MVGTLQRGVIAGLKTSWALGKIIFPVTLILALLQPTPLFSWLIDLVTPLMKWFGLSGDAAVPLVLGNLLGLYAAIGAMLTIELTVKEVFILAVMLSFSHNLIVESSVASRTGMSVWLMLAVRIGLAVVSSLLIAHLWDGGQELAQYGFVSPEAASPSGWGEIILAALKKAATGIVQLVAIVIPLMTIIQVLKERHWIEAVSRWMAPVTKMLGMSANTSLTLAAGFVFGLAYGAGVMIQAAKEDGVSKRDLTLAFIFLVSCHAVVEDTLIFVPLGIFVWPLLFIRLVTAVLLTMAVAFVWRRFEHPMRKEAAS
ncbi:nucleoside recognition domain-containing protein [Geobacillus stearothermophilus]|uniref:nucleoside recognition domain-containing protein n=1 Tax=Geobacillus stearothermophilus TaxID=1422 RepID=UPI002E1C0DE7|nr:nucleoside recognition domain-containing protein [Geobacillus stearothermophilus]MED4356128.1 nucleoside recognition domain-containing protein [Geobacillus stearothermophilus]